jgi:hypothetical protein
MSEAPKRAVWDEEDKAYNRAKRILKGLPVPVALANAKRLVEYFERNQQPTAPEQ